MKRLLVALLLVAVPLFAGAEEDTFSTWFAPETIRVDLIHTGDHQTSTYSLDEIVIEGPWPGTRTKLIDTLGLGDSYFHVYDAESEELIYSRGFSTMFGEWQTTAEADMRSRSMSESMRFPLPHKPVILTVSERNELEVFEEIYRVTIDPANENNRREIPFSDWKTYDLHIGSQPHDSYDIVILPDGYTADEQEKLLADAQRTAGYYMAKDPYKTFADHVSIRTIGIISRESGIDEPTKGIWRDTALDCSFNTFHSPRYVLSLANKQMRDIAANVPYDVIVIMVNSERYGGGGIYNLFNTFAADDEHAEYLVLHESGHSFAGLADEYYTSQVSYEGFYTEGVEPWEPNITALTDPENIKWKEYLTPGVPIPTPDTEEYDDVIGAFEGAGYVAKGFYRPMRDSIMKSRALNYGPINMNHMYKVLAFYSDSK